jgi:Xaa-Pro dipeptidase
VFYNRERLNEFLQRYDLKAVVATTPVNVTYLTGFSCWETQSFRENMTLPGAPNSLLQAYAIVSPDADPVLIVPAETFHIARELGVGQTILYAPSKPTLPTHGRREDLLHEYSDLVSSQAETPEEALESALKSISPGGRVGIEYPGLSQATLNASKKKKMADYKFLDCSEFIRQVRMVKTREEVSRMKRASAIAEDAMVKSMSQAKAGTRFRRMLQTFSTEVIAQGAVPEHYICSPTGLGISNVENYPLKGGDYTSIDCGCIYSSYYSDTGTTLILGHGQREVEKTFIALWEILDSSLDLLRPGEPSLSVLDGLDKGYMDRGIVNVDREGHGIGLETREPPIIKKGPYTRIRDGIIDIDANIPLEEGMTINIETPKSDLGQGAYQVERTFIVKKKGVEEITPARDGPYIVTR